LVAVHPQYARAVVIDEAEAARELEGLHDRLLAGAVVVDGEDAMAAEVVAGDDVARAREVPTGPSAASSEFELSLGMDASLVHADTSAARNAETDTSRLLSACRDWLLDPPPGPGGPGGAAGVLAVPRDEEPVCEFSHNNSLIAGLFSTLFPTGFASPTEGSVPAAYSRYLLQHSSGRFGGDHRLVLVLFDQLQRHASCRAAAARLKGDVQSRQAFTALVTEPGFNAALAAACADPTAPASKALSKRLSTIVQLTAGKIPFSTQGRASVLSKLYSMYQVRLAGLPLAGFVCPHWSAAARGVACLPACLLAWRTCVRYRVSCSSMGPHRCSRRLLPARLRRRMSYACTCPVTRRAQRWTKAVFSSICH
jgi:hypothetical protein